MNKSTQNQMVLRYLEEHGEISQLDAMKEFGIMRLGARIFDLRADGHNIKTTMGKSRNRWGEWTRYAIYRLIKE